MPIVTLAHDTIQYLEPDDGIKLYVLLFEVYKTPMEKEISIVIVPATSLEDLEKRHERVQGSKALLTGDDRPKRIIYKESLFEMLKRMAEIAGGDIW